MQRIIKGSLILGYTSCQQITDSQDAPVCRVLSLSGGGAKGAYEIGAIHTLYTSLPAPHNQYDVISGVSVGAINALGYSRFEKGDELNAAESMKGLWDTLENDKVYKSWPHSIVDPIHGLINEAGFFDNTPVYDLMLDLIKKRPI